MEKFIGAILAANGYNGAKTILRPSGGINNPIYIVDNALVIRFDGLTGSDEPEITTRFAAEQWVYARLYTAGLPVPLVITVDYTGQSAPPYMLLTKIPGRAVILSEELTLPQRQKIAFELGQFLARMHAVANFDSFGKWHQLHDGSHLTRWSQWPIGFFEHYAEWSERLGGAADSGLVRDLRALIHEAEPLFDQVTRGVICHRDCHFENVLQHGGKLTGVVDFEWWMSADPSCDFAVEDQWESIGDGCREAVYRGYTERRQLLPGHQKKVRIYSLLRDFDDVVSHFAKGNVIKVRDAVAKVRAGLDTV